MILLRCTCFVLVATTIGVFGSAAKNAQTVHHHMTSRELQKYFGVDQHKDVPEYDVTHPYQSTSAGTFLSYDLHSDHRSRRSTDIHDKRYNIRAFGKNMHLKLRENKRLLAPGLKVEEYQNGHVRRSELPMGTKHYIGEIEGDAKSIVALSYNDGLTGMIQTRDEPLFVRPIPRHLAAQVGHPTHATPHIVYRRAAKHLDSFEIDRDLPTYQASKRSLPQSHVTKRSLSNISTIEIGLVADDVISSIHGNDSRNYLLQMANVLHSLFQDSSIGAQRVSIAVTRLMFVRNADIGLSATDDKGTKLSMITTWASQNQINPESDDDPDHFDALVFNARGSDPGGLAQMSAICVGAIAPSMSNDIGLQTAMIIAHELGHGLGVGHDQTDSCPGGVNIMSGHSSGGPGAFQWSSCSKNVIQNFLSGPGSSCLKDLPPVPRPQFPHTNKLPGQLSDGDAQCKAMYNYQYWHCPQKISDCASLYCTNTNTTCSSSVVPPLDGTRCGPRHWCIRGTCVDDGSPIINGGWSEWSTYGDCSTTCGGGVQWRSRTCTNPEPANGGDDCEGSSKGHFRICNAEACPVEAVPFRRTQCQAFDPNYVEHYYSDPCKLVCRQVDYIYFFGNVADGTRCSSDPLRKDVCIAGACRSVGCDYILESGVFPDRCGVCNGNGTTCDRVHFEYTENWQYWGPNAAATMETLPVGSTKVVAAKRQVGYNVLGIQNSDGVYLISLPSWSTTVYAAGTKIVYEHNENLYRDRILIEGPTTEKLLLKFVYVYEVNGGVDIDYFRPVSGVLGSNVSYQWATSNWTSCSTTCAGGERSRVLYCVRSDDNTFASHSACDAALRPASVEACNTQTCPPEWHVTEWDTCSKTCGRGSQSRAVFCRKKTTSSSHETIDDQICLDSGLTRPNVTEVSRYCNEIPCPPEWVPLAWSECSTTCSTGVTTRQLECRRLEASGVMSPPILPENCDHAIKPPTSEPCNSDNPCTPNEEIEIACFVTNSDIAVLADLTENLDLNNTAAIVQQCTQLAHAQGFKYFALGDNGICYSDADTNTTYFLNGETGKNNCYAGVGRAGYMFVYTLESLPTLVNLGCYRDDYFDRALPTFYANMRDQIVWENMNKTISQCAHIARNKEYDYFGVQFYGECWSSSTPLADLSYTRHGDADNCWAGVGGDWSFQMYRLGTNSKK
ncbi:A disintegrin and metalloproteinase with thrombospondin motifs 18 isoform X2 [Nematostella vectensis]|nr:A disintegrin and metalloproteinase with thrombospondin motifs 18 isoform X2 [Nematostella vectensis]